MSTEIITQAERDNQITVLLLASFSSVVQFSIGYIPIFLICNYFRMHIVSQLFKGLLKQFDTIALESHAVSPGMYTNTVREEK